jgi:hypothetical protein
MVISPIRGIRSENGHPIPTWKEKVPYPRRKR